VFRLGWLVGGALLIALALGACGRPAGIDAATGRPGKVRPQVIVPVQVSATIATGDDDGEEYSDGRVNRGSHELELVDAATNQTVGLRFTNVDIGQGNAIAHAYIQFTASSGSTGAAALTIQAEAADDAGPLTSHYFGVSSRARTTASASWSPTGWVGGDAGTAEQTVDIAPVIQEVVNRPGWVSGNAILIVITGSGTRTAWAYDGQPAAAATLHVEKMVDNHPPQIDSFAAAPSPVDRGVPVTFTWSASSAEGQALSCTLDVNGDGTPEFTYSDCNAGSGQSYTYGEGGTFDPALAVTDTDNTTVTSVQQLVVNQTVVIGAAGDIACDPTRSKNRYNKGLGTDAYCRELYTSDQLIAMQPDAVIALGDTQYEYGTLSAFMESYDPTWGRVKGITFPAVGNHEYLTSGASGYYTYFGSAAGDPSKGYYSWDLGNWHFVALNSNCSKAGGCSAGSPQESWLRQDLAAHPTACTLAYWHHPLYSSGAIGGRTWTYDIWQALLDNHADIILTGHDHDYERFAPQDNNGNYDPTGITEFVVGTGGKSPSGLGTLQPNSMVFQSDIAGVLELTLKPTSYTFDFQANNSPFTDSGSATCN